MKIVLFRIALASMAVLGVFQLSVDDIQANTATRFEPCVCYTYFSNGHVEVGESCDHPTVNGACSRIVPCLPQNKEDQ